MNQKEQWSKILSQLDFLKDSFERLGVAYDSFVYPSRPSEDSEILLKKEKYGWQLLWGQAFGNAKLIVVFISMVRVLVREPELARIAFLTIRYRLFDIDYYSKCYPDIVDSGCIPFVHFLKNGLSEGRNPHPLIDISYYSYHASLTNNDVIPFAHFVLQKSSAEIAPIKYFNFDLYKRKNSKVDFRRINPFVHYLKSEYPEAVEILTDESLDREFLLQTEEIQEMHRLAKKVESAFKKEEDFSKVDELILDVGLAEALDNFSAEEFEDRHEHSDFSAKLLAFYLPQFHPIPENDEWWGKGFTEWTNVTKAEPQFLGHYQPHLPSELGFYDLRVPEIMSQQAELAKEHGIYGFCYYYYWFEGRRLLERPLKALLETGQPDFPFCLCWANENWSRRWDGSEQEVLMKQNYSKDCMRNFIESVIPYFKDSRYITVDNRPVLLIYRANEIPNIRSVTDEWREICRSQGFPGLHLCAVQSFGLKDPEPFGFDAAVEFPPHLDESGRVEIPYDEVPLISDEFEGELLDYVGTAKNKISDKHDSYIQYRGLMLSWDNTARKNNRSTIFINSCPKAYRYWLYHLIEQAYQRRHEKHPFIFINAWNEWAEGTHLEPDRKYGRAYLEATRDALHFFYKKLTS